MTSVNVVPSNFNMPITNFKIDWCFNMNLKNSVSFQVFVFNNSQQLYSTQMTLSGDDYKNWGTDDDYIINYVAKKLGLTVNPTTPTVTPSAPTVTPYDPAAPTVTPSAPTVTLSEPAAPAVTPSEPAAPAVTLSEPAAPAVTPSEPVVPSVPAVTPSEPVVPAESSITPQ